MSIEPRFAFIPCSLSGAGPAVAMAILLSGVASTARADDRPMGPRVAVCQSVTPAGTLLHHAGSGSTWRPVKAKDDVYSNDVLVAISEAAIVTKNGAVRLK